MKGVWLTCRHAFPELAKSGAGAIVNIASIAGVSGGPGQSAYGASKAGVVQLTRNCANEGAEKGIRANSIAPGGIVTPMSFRLRPARSKEEEYRRNAQQNPLARTGLPDDIAYAALWLGSDEARFVTGQNIVIDGGATMLRNPQRTR